MLFLLSVMLMRCHDCQRELPTDEPVYRVRRSRLGFPVWTSVCAGCLSLATDKTRQWLPAGRCYHCGRPVIADRIRKGSQFVICSPECREAIHNERYRQLHGKPKTAHCHACGQEFVPKRSDAKFCSVACQQRAYRSKQRAL